MAALTALGLDRSEGTLVCVAAPDSVLGEAAAMKPRPAFASSLLTASPAERILWWPGRSHLTETMLARLRWLLETSAGEAWLLIDIRDDDAPRLVELREALTAAGFHVGAAVCPPGETGFLVSL